MVSDVTHLPDSDQCSSARSHGGSWEQLPHTLCGTGHRSEVRNDATVYFALSYMLYNVLLEIYLLWRPWRAHQWHVYSCRIQRHSGLNMKKKTVGISLLVSIGNNTHFLLCSGGSFMSFCILEKKIRMFGERVELFITLKPGPKTYPQ